MELIEARALKSSFISGMSLKPSLHQVFQHDLWCVAGINGVSGDDFSVDDLLDFSGEDFKDDKSHDSGEDEEKDSFSESSQHRNSEISTFSATESLGTISSGELPVPVDDFENLEWLSQFVDESTSEFSLLCPAGAFKDKTGSFSKSSSEPVTRALVQKTTVPCFPVTFPVKSRTKRSRPAGIRTWSLLSPTVSSDSSYGSSPSSSSYGSSPFTYDLFCSVEKPSPAKKPKKRVSSPETNSGGFLVQRRCSHCQVQKTPQWRTGPSGPKTLCNACGVRYKSGRLFPEYRPACSPTFSQEVHSNSHRKVIEMRQRKVVLVVAEVVEPGLTPVC